MIICLCCNFLVFGFEKLCNFSSMFGIVVLPTEEGPTNEFGGICLNLSRSFYRFHFVAALGSYIFSEDK